MKNLAFLLLFACAGLIASTGVFAQEKNSSPMSESTFTGLKFRNLGPALTSGRLSDIAIHPEDDNIWYITVGSGGVWKTMNAGVTWTPIFDGQKVYSTGCVTIDPLNPNTVWVGTGEDVGGRHVGIGDGVYRSDDGGKSWKNMGLNKTEHIARVRIHPENSDVVFVAAQGPLWNKGDERGLYKSTDGGKNWKKVLGDAEWVGVTDLVIDPRNPDWMYAATWQRHRNVAAYMGGGPGSGIHRSTDGGETWTKLTRGIPGSNLGKIGLAISPQNPDYVYAAIEMNHREGGVFMSKDRGMSWKKMSNAVAGATGPHYYQELFACPHEEGRLYLMDNNIQISDDHGKTFRRMNESKKHGDNHAIAWRMDDPDYLLIGTDGGIYESFDLAQNWRFMSNLPVTQFYKLAVDDAEPFYNIMGGTQDNGTQGGPSRTDNSTGIINEDWRDLLGADGHQPATEPGNPDIAYGEFQEGVLFRIDMKTLEATYIQPQAGEGDPHERFNWDAPILVSPHKPSRIYHASYRVWKSENRGDSWEAISGDLTRNQERLALPIMGRKQSYDNAWDLFAMSTYNTITSLAESPVQEGLMYAGTDDGIIQVTEDGGENWRKIEVGSIKDVPATAFVNDIRADLFDAKTVYVCLDNHKFGDYKPYVLKSTDAGKSWTSIRGNLPDKHLIWRLVQDHVEKDLLFAATEYGIFFTPDGGNKWIELNGGIPTISFRDITIQRRENDLVAASFGRGFFVLDDITPLREVTATDLSTAPVLFPVKDAWWFFPRRRWVNGGDKYIAPNPPTGAVFTYYMPESLKTKKAERKEKEKKLDKANQDVPFPGYEALDDEAAQKKPEIRFTIKDSQGNLVKIVKGKTSKGIHRVVWNMQTLAKMGLRLGQDVPEYGPTVVPGTYTVSMSKVVDGVTTELAGPQSFELVPLRQGALEGASYAERQVFTEELQAMQQDFLAFSTEIENSQKLLKTMQAALFTLDEEPGELEKRVHDATETLRILERKINGSPSANKIGEKQPPSPQSRFWVGFRGLGTSYGPTEMHKQSVAIAKSELQGYKAELTELVDVVLPQLQKDLKEAGAPWIEGEGLIK